MADNPGIRTGRHGVVVLHTPVVVVTTYQHRVFDDRQW
jgi:hypothetical protein